MKHIHQFDHHLYHKTLERQIGGGLPVFTGYRQRGAGLGSIFGLIGKYILPVFRQHILPHAKSAILNTVKDVVEGKTLKDSMLDQGGALIQNVGKSITTKRSEPQTGSGLSVRKRPASNVSSSVTFSHSSSKQPKKKAKKDKSHSVSKRDIFDQNVAD